MPIDDNFTRQDAKEMACRLAIKSGYGLLRRGDKEMWRVYPDERTLFLCRSENIHDLWHSAVRMIEYEEEQRPKISLSKPLRFAASILHNCVIHPIMPFTWGLGASIADGLHDFTAKLAFE